VPLAGARCWRSAQRWPESFVALSAAVMGRRDPILAHPPASRLSGSGKGEPAGGGNWLN
jgi:hypothetical protein